MDRDALIAAWKTEEEIAHIHGWDFSPVEGRVVEAPPPWDYREEILRHLKPEMRILDIDTGGGEFLLSLQHPHKNTAAKESFRPIRFYDVGALVWFARIIEWEFPGFNVDSCLDRLFAVHERLTQESAISGTAHCIFLEVRKQQE